MNPLLCPKCLKFFPPGDIPLANSTLFCGCQPLVTVTLTLTNGTVYVGKTENPFRQKPRVEVPSTIYDAFKDGELEV